jgi:ribosomal protein S18 acetylase RimI-like enzyme
MELRVLDEGDAPAWWELRMRALQEEPLAFGKSVEEHRTTPVEVIAERLRGSSEENFTLGAFDHGALVGMATYIRETGLKERHKGRIYAVYVDREFRGTGVGRALIATLLEVARRDPSLEQILLAVSACQDAARGLYRGFGFTTFGIEPNALKIGGRYVDEEHMILSIPDMDLRMTSRSSNQ